MTRVEVIDKVNHRYYVLDQEPYEITRDMVGEGTGDLEFRFHFQGHYSEPYFTLEVPRGDMLELQPKQQLICDIRFDFDKMDWL